ncbi:hypothetical protein SASPL_156434 [Salvia splendens]|uniref:RRM domain-containing protein n=1 Tax=Salvia splendens TaxID=180675 RepID=A0A8X8VWP9_SALSN|nr:hypothetical protein SASPL_156434 [Salvia splendens]
MLSNLMSYSRRSRSPSPYNKRYSRSFSRSPIPSRSRSRSYDSRDAENPGNNLYVTGLSARVTKRDLEKHFSTEGKVEDVHLVVDPRTRESRGFGFVTMSSLKEAERCIKYLDRSVLEGRVISVEKTLSLLYWIIEVSLATGLDDGGDGHLLQEGILGLKQQFMSVGVLLATRLILEAVHLAIRLKGIGAAADHTLPATVDVADHTLPITANTADLTQLGGRTLHCITGPGGHRIPVPVPVLHLIADLLDYSPEDRYYRRSRYRSISPRYRRSSKRSYSRSLTSRSYSRSVSPTPTRDVSPSLMKCLKRSQSPRKRAPSRTSRSHSRSASASSSSPSASKSVSPRR